MIPKTRNIRDKTKDDHKKKYWTRMKEPLPVNHGVADGVITKEHPWAGPFDRDFGEFYKKTNINPIEVPSEQALFINFF